jgi:hypothetical protein
MLPKGTSRSDHVREQAGTRELMMIAADRTRRSRLDSLRYATEHASRYRQRMPFAEAAQAKDNDTTG